MLYKEALTLNITPFDLNGIFLPKMYLNSSKLAWDMFPRYERDQLVSV